MGLFVLLSSSILKQLETVQFSPTFPHGMAAILDTYEVEVMVQLFGYDLMAVSLDYFSCSEDGLSQSVPYGATLFNLKIVHFCW